MSATRKRSNSEILTSLACNFTEAAQVLNVGWRTVEKLVDDKKLKSYKSGQRTKIVVRSLIDYQEREAA